MEDVSGGVVGIVTEGDDDLVGRQHGVGHSDGELIEILFSFNSRGNFSDLVVDADTIGSCRRTAAIGHDELRPACGALLVFRGDKFRSGLVDDKIIALLLRGVRIGAESEAELERIVITFGKRGEVDGSIGSMKRVAVSGTSHLKDGAIESAAGVVAIGSIVLQDSRLLDGAVLADGPRAGGDGTIDEEGSGEDIGDVGGTGIDGSGLGAFDGEIVGAIGSAGRSHITDLRDVTALKAVGGREGRTGVGILSLNLSRGVMLHIGVDHLGSIEMTILLFEFEGFDSLALGVVAVEAEIGHAEVLLASFGIVAGFLQSQEAFDEASAGTALIVEILVEVLAKGAVEGRNFMISFRIGLDEVPIDLDVVDTHLDRSGGSGSGTDSDGSGRLPVGDIDNRIVDGHRHRVGKVERDVLDLGRIVGEVVIVLGLRDLDAKLRNHEADVGLVGLGLVAIVVDGVLELDIGFVRLGKIRLERAGILQLDLGDFRADGIPGIRVVVRDLGGQVGLVEKGVVDVDVSGALNSRRGINFAGGVIDGIGRGHGHRGDKLLVLSESRIVGGSKGTAVGRLLFGKDGGEGTAEVRCGHGGTAHIVIADNARSCARDIRADGADDGRTRSRNGRGKIEVIARSVGGEGGEDIAVRSVLDGILGDGKLSGGIDRTEDGTQALINEDDRDLRIVIVEVEAEVEGDGRIVVDDDKSDGTGIIRSLSLGLERRVSTIDDGNITIRLVGVAQLTFEESAVSLDGRLIIGVGTIAADAQELEGSVIGVVITLEKLRQRMLEIIAQRASFFVDDLVIVRDDAVADSDDGVEEGLFGVGRSDDVGSLVKERRAAEDARFGGVGGEVAIALRRGEGRLSGITGGIVDDDTGIDGTLNSLIGRGRCIVPAIDEVRSERQVDDVELQLGGIVESGDDGRVSSAGSIVREDLHDGKLGVGGNTFESFAIGSGKRSDMGSVISVFWIRIDIVVVSVIVVGKSDLVAIALISMAKTGRIDGIRGQDIIALFIGEILEGGRVEGFSGIGGIGNGRVSFVRPFDLVEDQTGIDDTDGDSLTELGFGISASGSDGAIDVASRGIDGLGGIVAKLGLGKITDKTCRAGRGIGCLRRSITMLNRDGIHASDVFDHFDAFRIRFDSKSVEDRIILSGDVIAFLGQLVGKFVKNLATGLVTIDAGIGSERNDVGLLFGILCAWQLDRRSGRRQGSKGQKRCEGSKSS